MKLFNVNLGSQSMDEHYEHGKGKPQQIDAFRVPPPLIS